MYQNYINPTSPIIDKLTLVTGDFRIKPNSDLMIRTTTCPATGDTTINRFYNSKEHHFTIDVQTNKVTGVDSMRIMLNPAKTPISVISDMIHEVGVITNLHESKVTRMDICRDKLLKHDTRAYHQTLKAAKSGKATFNITNDTTVWVGNNIQEVTFYNKSDESNLSISNVHRMEVKLKKKAWIRKSGITILDDVMKLGNSDIMNIYLNAGKRILPNLYTIPDEGTIVAYFTKIIQYLDEHDSRPVSSAHKFINISFHYDAFMAAIECAGFSKQKKYRWKKSTKDDVMKFQPLIESLNLPTNSIKDELISYFVAA